MIRAKNKSHIRPKLRKSGAGQVVPDKSRQKTIDQPTTTNSKNPPPSAGFLLSWNLGVTSFLVI